MDSMRQLARLVAAAVVVFTAVGCGANKVYPVKGKVTLDGKPMKGGGSISFQPVTKQDGKAAGGEIAEDGTYNLMTHKPGDGSMTGEFRVVIIQVTEREPNATNDGEKAGKSVAIVPKADRIPRIYSDPANTPLTAKVEAKNNEINFDLKSNAGPVEQLNQGGAMAPFHRRDDVARLDRKPFSDLVLFPGEPR